MKVIYIICSFLILHLVVACKQEATTSQEAENTTAATETQASASTATGHDMSLGHDYNFLTHEVLVFNASIGGEKDGIQPFKDQWVDLDPNGTYKGGKLQEQTHTGKWSYDHDKTILFLKPDVSTFPMSEWKVMVNNQMMVWIGTQTYGNQSTQIQILRKDKSATATEE